MYFDILFIVGIMLMFLFLVFFPITMYGKILLDNMLSRERHKESILEIVQYVVLLQLLALGIFCAVLLALESLSLNERFKPSYIMSHLFGDGSKPIWVLHWDLKNEQSNYMLANIEGGFADQSGRSIAKYTYSSDMLDRYLPSQIKFGGLENNLKINEEFRSLIRTLGLDYLSMLYFYLALLILPVISFMFFLYWFRLQGQKEDAIGIGNMPLMNLTGLFIMNLGWIILFIIHSTIASVLVSAFLPYEAGTVSHNFYHSIQYLWGQILQPN